MSETIQEHNETIKVKIKNQKLRRCLLEVLTTIQKDMTSKRVIALRKKITEVLMEE